MHGRLIPKRNFFTYGIYYLFLPLSQLENLLIKDKHFAPISFCPNDHGPCDGSDLNVWIRNILAEYGLSEANGEVTLVCMPRILGYVFNPVSFWLCQDKDGHLRAVVCEVNNTFGERHNYICAHEDHRPITSGDTLRGNKVFHVSPFLKREGAYEFRFDLKEDTFGVWIDFYNADAKKQLVTSLTGSMISMTSKTLRKAFWRYPLVTLKAIILIHWQALKLIFKGIKYIPKPPQKQKNLTSTDKLTKM
jgi:DUF1365 family protein